MIYYSLMAESVQIAVFEDGKISVRSKGEAEREAVLALPLSRLLVKMVRVPAESAGDAAAYCAGELQAMSPYPDEALTVSCETVRETVEGIVVLAAALPEGSADDIADALDEAKLNVTRVDALALGRLRELWTALSDGRTDVRRLVLLGGAECVSVFVLDDDMPCAVRAVSPGSDMRRELMLSLLEAEDFGGARPVAEVVVAGNVDAEEGVLAAFGPVRRIGMDETSVAGVAERSEDPACLNALPQSWREVLEETRFKTKLRKFLVVAGGMWALVMAILFGVPMTYGFMTTHQRNLSKEHARRYTEVKEMREKVRLVQKYSDHSLGALEVLKVVSDNLPEGIELNSWNFRRGESAKFSGESDDASGVYTLKDRLLETKAFADVVLTGPSAGRGGKQRFDIDCRFEAEEER